MSKFYPFSPGNPLVLEAEISDIDPVTGRAIPMPASATVDAFIASTSAPDAAAAHASLTATGVHCGLSTKYPTERSRWLITFPAAILLLATLDPLFASAPMAYVIIQKPSGFRENVPIRYERSKVAIAR